MKPSVIYCLATLSLGILSIIQVAQATGGEESGKALYQRWCSGCHADSPYAPGTSYLRQHRSPGLAVIDRRTDLSAEFVRALVRRGQGGMPSYRTTEMTDTELARLIDYLISNN